MQLANYLFFTTCEPALTFYSECGLGRITLLVRHSRE
jgi:PhnB protein